MIKKISNAIVTLIFFISILVGCQTNSSNLATEKDNSKQVYQSNSVDIQAIKDLFAEMEKSWNKGDAKKWSSLWMDGSKLITRNGTVHMVKEANSEERVASILQRIKEEGEYRYKPHKIDLKNPKEANATVDWSCQSCWQGRQANRRVNYELAKVDGSWKIRVQDFSR